MRILAVALASLIVLLQWPLWIGKGSWLKVWQIESQLADQRKSNEKLKVRNAALDAEVRDLKTGTDAIEERARNELGMVRPEEVFFQVLDKPLEEPPLPGLAGSSAVAEVQPPANAQVKSSTGAVKTQTKQQATSTPTSGIENHAPPKP